MSAKKWMQGLSIIALVLIIVEIIAPLSFAYGANFKLTSISLAILLLAISEVIRVFGKK